jgi:hypothetical protein
MVSLREKTLHDRRSSSAATASTDDGTIGTYRGKAHCKSFPGALIVVVFCTGENRVVQITCSSSKIVLQTTKKNMMYLGSGPSLEVIAPCLVV